MILTEIYHPSHCHKLELKSCRGSYKCDGCKETGFGARYRCDYCDYDLHKDCALAAPSKTHPFFKKCFFEFREEGQCGRFCDICARGVSGFVYHCNKYGFNMHPCCVNLPHIIHGDGLKLVLKKSMSSKCVKCGIKKLSEKVKGWSYKSDNGKCQFHVSCVKDLQQDFYGDGESNGLVSLDDSIPPNLQRLLLQNGASSSRGRVNKYLKTVKVGLKIVTFFVTGDPTVLYTSLIG